MCFYVTERRVPHKSSSFMSSTVALSKKRAEKDSKIVKDLLGYLKVDETAFKSQRVGNYDEDSDQPRPIKVTFQKSSAQ